ncbi:NADH-quinone oxidoreductase subunit B [Longibacter salinarum]|uniref:NADH-quinone oxidoreductase subunit B n=1 Tax=Longibacter salinarum TaxID=1850348 RepID=A0A2A8CX69_9BACT|nr:NADH-quinone oxidoreductase subunit B [Longibacter salinarum]PEN13167.1 NADH-quinone oxidoreductase subunit B [Longibacter salinarum]
MAGMTPSGGEGFFTTRVDAVLNWARSNSLMPMPMGLACCAIEMMAFAGPKYDAARFGSEAMRFSPRQADLMIVAGWCSYKMSHAIRRVWDQMPDPKWCIAMGACASTGGMHRCYGVVQGIDNFLPVDVYIPGCPPRPEAVLHALMDIQEKIRNEYSVLQDYTDGPLVERAPIVHENSSKFPGQLEKPKTPNFIVEAPGAKADDATRKSKTAPMKA